MQELLDQLYDAAVDAHAWSPALRRCGEMLDVDMVALAAGERVPPRVRVLAASGVSAELVAEYNSQHADRDQLVLELIRRPIGMMLRGELMRSPVGFGTTRLHRHLLQPAGLECFAAFNFVTVADPFSSLWLARRGGSPPFDEATEDALERLVPHMARATAISRRLTSAQLQTEAVAGAFDRVGLGLLLVDSSGRAILTNREAERILGDNDGFSLTSGRVAATDQRATRRLLDLIRGASHRDDIGDSMGRGVRLARPSGLPDYQAMVLSLPKRMRAQAARAAVAVLFISDHRSTHLHWQTLARDLHGLTAAEIRLLGELLQGQTLTDSARQLGLSRNTAHTQLTSIFRKTGTRRQNELILLMLRGPAAVCSPDETSGAFHRFV
jgi:DNA-binding CsgD family transcriptional regulator